MKSKEKKKSIMEKRSAMEVFATAALSHRDASIILHNEFYKLRPEATGALFPAFLMIVSFEMIVLSIEQSLKLLLMLHFSSYQLKGGHNIYNLLMILDGKGRSKAVNAPHRGLLRKLLVQANKILDHEGNTIRPPITKSELKKVFKKHQNSYSDLRYLGVGLDLKQKSWGIETRSEQIMHCMALALIEVNRAKMDESGMKPYQMKETEEIKSLNQWSLRAQ